MGCVPPCRQQVRGSAPWPQGLAGVRDGLFPFTKGSSLLSLAGFKCPICSKSVASDEMEMHFIMCLSKPRLSYNGKGWQPGAAGGTAPRCLGTQTLASGGAGRRLGQACQEGCAPAEPRSHRPCPAPLARLGPAAFAFGTLCDSRGSQPGWDRGRILPSCPS